MSRIRRALELGLRDAVQLAENTEPAQPRDMGGGNVELILRGAVPQPAARTSSAHSPANNGHAAEADREPQTRAADGAERKHLLPGFGGRSLPEEKGRAQVTLSEQGREQVTKLVQRVFVFSNSSAPRAVVFSGIDKGSGSTEMCFHAGRVLAAELAGSVCLVDANLHAPLLHQLAGVEKAPGLSEAINAPEPAKSFATQIGRGNLWIMPAGAAAAGAPGRFSPDGMRLLMKELRDTFDYILIDASPVGSAAHAVLLGQMADGMILVVEANFTRRETARNVKETLDSAGVKLLGAILKNQS